jgi:hypothetical protein
MIKFAATSPDLVIWREHNTANRFRIEMYQHTGAG